MPRTRHHNPPLKPRTPRDEHPRVADVRKREDTSCDEPSSAVVPASISTLLSNARERRSFEYFYSHTIPQFSGVLESSVWIKILLQAAHSEPALRHAGVALGALHEASSNIGTEEDGFAVQQYVKSIRLLMKPIKEDGHQAVDVALLACILYVYFETLRGYHGAALSHIDGGVKILSSLQSSKHSNSSLALSSNPYFSTSDLTTIFMRLDGQAATVVQDWHRDRIPFPTPPGCQFPIPIVFRSLEEARYSLDISRHVGVREIRATIDRFRTNPQKLVLGLSLIKTNLQIKLKMWRQALDRFVQAQQSTFDQDSLNALHILKMWRLLMSMNVSTLGIANSGGVWDSFMPQFKAIIDHASQVAVNDTRNLVISLDQGIILPLYFVALKCRDREIRRQAIELMRSNQRYDGIWSSLMTVKLAERLVEIEEMGLGEVTSSKDVPIERRVSGIGMVFDKDEKKAFLQFGQLPQPALGEVKVICEEWIEW